MSEQIPPQEPPFSAPYTNVPYTEVPGAGPASYPPPAGSYPPPSGSYPSGSYPTPVAAAGLSENAAAALAYVTIIPAIIFLVLEPYSKMRFVRFHAIQCLGLAVVSFVLQVGITMVGIFLRFIPLIGILFSLVHLAVFLVIAAAWLMALIKASQGQWFKLPVIGDFAEGQARR